MTKTAPHRELRVEILARPEDDHWSAVVPAYTIAGRGDTAQQAVENAVMLLVDYLNVCLREGLSVEQARRPAAFPWRARLVMAKLIHRLGRDHHRGDRVEERDLGLSDGHLVVC